MVENMRPVFVGNIDYKTREADLHNLFSKYGRVDHVDVKSGYAFVYFDDERDAEVAIRALDSYLFGFGGERRKLSVEWARGERASGHDASKVPNQMPNRTLCVRYFDPIKTQVRDLERHFHPYGKILSVRIRNNHAFVEFENMDDATKALESTHRSKMLDNAISVEYAQHADDERGDGRSWPILPCGSSRSRPDYGHDRPRSPVHYYGGPAYDSQLSPVFDRISDLKVQGGMKQKCSRGGEFTGEKKRILVHVESKASKTELELGISSGSSSSSSSPRTRSLTNYHFHLVDLEGDIHQKYLPSLVMYTWGYMTALDNSIYILGGSDPSLINTREFEVIQSWFPEPYKEFYMGGARIDFDPDHQPQGAVWKKAPFPTEELICSNCTGLLGKLYNFGCPFLKPEVLDPAVGKWQKIWRPLPRELVNCRVSDHPLPDPTNHRFFVHLEIGVDYPCLYTFMPLVSEGTQWECVETDFRWWTDISTILEGVIYFHSLGFPSFLKAYDVADKKWLKVSWASSFENAVDMYEKRLEIVALISLGDDILCFAGSMSIYDSSSSDMSSTQLVFYNFRVERSDDNVSLIPLSFRTYELPDTRSVCRFLPV